MKKNLGLLLLFLGVAVATFGQTAVTVKDTITKRYQSGIKYPSPKVADQAAGVKYLVDWTNIKLNSKADTSAISSRVAHATSTALRLGLVGSPDVVILYDKQGYTFRRDITNSMPDDSAMVIRLGSTIRYVRVTPILTPEFFGAVGDNSADDSNAFQKCLNHTKSSGLPIELGEKTYKITRTLNYITGTSNWTQGFVMTGKGTERTIIMPRGFTGPLFNINGSSPGQVYHVTGSKISNFAITRLPGDNSVIHGFELNSTYHTTISEVDINEIRGDGVRIFSTGTGDLATNEFLTLKNMYIRYLGGWGLNCRASGTGSATWAEGTADGILIVGCNKGMFLEGLQQVHLKYGSTVLSADSNMVISNRNITTGPLNIESYEIGNVMNNIPQLVIGRAINVQINLCRFINNPNEGATTSILVTGDANSIANNIVINQPWIVQADYTNPSYRFIRFASGHVGYQSKIALTRVNIADMADGKVIDDVNYKYLSEYTDNFGNSLIPPRLHGTFSDNNPTSLQPKEGERVHVLSYTSDTETTISQPTWNPHNGERMTFVSRNNGGRGTLLFNGTYYSTGSINARNEDLLYSSRTFVFVYEENTNTWYLEGAGLKPSVAPRQETNPSTITPKVGESIRAAYNITTSTTIANPSGTYKENDTFTLAVWNTVGAGVTATFTLGNAYNSPGTIEFPTVAYQGYILKFEYLGGYWWRVR